MSRLGLGDQQANPEPDPAQSYRYDGPANEQKAPTPTPTPPPADELVRCNNCERTFFPEKLISHQKICKPGKPLQRTTKGQGQKYRPPAPKTQTQWKPPVDQEMKQERASALINSSFEQEKTAYDTGSYRETTSNSSKSPIKIQQPDDEDRVECGNCGRKFFADRIEKHEKICQGQKKRPVFKTQDKRMIDPSQKKYGKSPKKQRQAKSKAQTSRDDGKKSKWKQQSDQLKAAMRAN